MRKILLSLIVLSVSITLDSSNLCLGPIPKASEGYLCRHDIGTVFCDCDCWNQPKVRLDHGRGYACAICGHRQIPEAVFKQSGSRKGNRTFKPKKYERFSQGNPANIKNK